MDVNPGTRKLEPTEMRYHLKFRVVVVEHSFEDEQSTGKQQVTDQMVLLLPQESSQRDLFFAAWLPDLADQHHELGLMLGYPVSAPCRAAIYRRGKLFSEHHLFVMSKGAEEDLKEMVREARGKEVYVEGQVLGEQEDTTCDLMRDHDLPGRRHYPIGGMV